MNAEQKRAWLGLISCVVCLVLFAVLAPFIGAQAAMGAFGILGVNGFRQLIGRGEKLDERDTSILRRAVAVGFVASYLTFVLALMGVWIVTFECHGRSQISVHVLPIIGFWGFLMVILVQSVAVLVGYRRHAEADDV